jgi:hypothetical protein
VLGLYAPPDAAPATAVATVAPPGKPGPAGLRIRTASRDWFVESRTESHYEVFTGNGTELVPLDIAKPMPVGGVIVSGAERRYTTDETGYFPNPYRYAPAAGADCDAPGQAECGGAAEVFVPGTSLTVPGAFRLDVLPAAPDGTSQVQTTWLDTTPPVLKSVKGRIERPWGSSSGTVVVEVTGTADGAGIAALEVAAGSKTTRVDADTMTSLVAGSGRASVRIKAPRSGVVRTSLVDAAGRRSTVRGLKVATMKVTRPAATAYAPRGGDGFSTAPTVPAGTRLRVTVRTDPKTAGLPVYVWALGAGKAVSKRARVSKRGLASATITLPKGDVQIVVQVPKRKGGWIDQPRLFYHVG